MKNLNFDAHFQDLFDNSNDLIQFLDPDGRILKVNQAWLKTLGYQPDDVLGKSIYDFISACSSDSYRSYRKDVMAGSRVAELEFIFIGKGGVSIILEGQIGCVYQDRQPVYTRAVFRDVTAKKEAEKLIEKNQRRLSAFIFHAPSAVIIIDQHQLVQEWNPKAEEIFGFTSFEVVGSPLADIIIPEQFREAHALGMAHFLKTGQGPVLNKTVELTALHQSGREFPVSLNISSVQIEEKWLFIAFISDITMQKQLQEDVIRKEAALLQSKIEEDKKDEFLSMASHELKTPLTSLKAYLQLLERRSSSDSSFPLLGRASRYVSKLEMLISDLLDVSKIKADKIQYHFKDVAFSELLRECTQSIQLFTNSHEIIIEHCDDVSCRADSIRLEQVIHNLLTNAIKYSPDGDKILVNTKLQGDRIITSIRDFGIGIARENQGNLFNRYYRVDNPDMKFQGMGIGLFITMEIVQRHQGELWVESELGKGSVFYFSLPCT